MHVRLIAIFAVILASLPAWAEDAAPRREAQMRHIVERYVAGTMGKERIFAPGDPMVAMIRQSNPDLTTEGIEAMKPEVTVAVERLLAAPGSFMDKVLREALADFSQHDLDMLEEYFSTAAFAKFNPAFFATASGGKFRDVAVEERGKVLQLMNDILAKRGLKLLPAPPGAPAKP